MYRAGIYRNHIPMLGATAIANSSGLAKAVYPPVPEGYAWYIERYSIHCPTAAAVGAVFVVQGATGTGAIDPSYRADYTTAGADAVGDSFSAIYVPAGYSFAAQWTSATHNDVCVASIQVAVHELNPREFMTPEDQLQVRAAHEHVGSPLVQVATAGERAV